MIKEAIKKAVEGNDLTRAEATAAMEAIMNGESTDAQIGAFIVAMRLKGETVEEISSFARIMREKATHIDAGTPIVLDVVGTGGDGAHTFNISTISAFVAAGAGITVAKHGNRAVSSKCGSADLLKEIGINLETKPERLSECLQQVGVAFLFAPMLHASMKYAIGPRREIGVRTFFNILGPMTNPAGANRLLLGVYSEELVEIIAGVLADLGCERAFVVHGADGLDEITTTTETIAAEVNNGVVKKMTISPGEFGIKQARPEDLVGGSSAENARYLLSVLSGEPGPKRDIVLLNSAFAICAGGGAETPEAGLKVAAEAIDSGAALKKCEALKEFTNA